MQYPKLNPLPSTRQTVDAFRGYNHNLRIGDNEFFQMTNMTSDHYPVLSPRDRRGIYAQAEDPRGILAKDKLCYIDGSAIVIGDELVDMDLTRQEDKQLISMGGYILILPDKKYINTLDLSDRGSIEHRYTSQKSVTFRLCSLTGEDYSGATVAEKAPEKPENGDLWLDTSGKPHSLKKYSGATGQWGAMANTYIRITCPGIGRGFRQYDGVSISGITTEGAKDLNGSAIVQDRGDDYLVVTGILDALTTQQNPVTVERTMPDMDFLTESENRLWGCRYGVDASGKMVNELYACKLGDFRNWNCFMGLSTDSYAASCGTDGPFTGAITHLGYPLFFKENFVHKVYGNYPANFQIQTTACRGVQKGSHGSLAIVNELLYYKSRSSVCAYDGSLPVEISYALGNESYSQAVGGAHGNKYYISMMDVEGDWHLFVYDTARSMWHREDSFHAVGFCSWAGQLYGIDRDSGKIHTMGKGDAQSEPELCWEAETGEIGITTADMKYLSRLTVRMALEVGTEIQFFARYDFSETWEPVFALTSTSLRSFSIPIRPKRCDHMRLRIRGTGRAKIYSITKTMEQGSDIS